MKLYRFEGSMLYQEESTIYFLYIFFFSLEENQEYSIRINYKSKYFSIFRNVSNFEDLYFCATYVSTDKRRYLKNIKFLEEKEAKEIFPELMI